MLRNLSLTLSLAMVVMNTAHGQTKRLEVYEHGSAADQLEADITPIPAGMGAIFVPSTTVPTLEPSVSVRFGGDRVAWGRTGSRLVVPPGEYEVVVGHGGEAQRAHTTVRVVAGITSMTQPFFSALRVIAVDENGLPITVDYSVEDANGKEVINAQTTDVPGYGETHTYLLAPGKITIALHNGDHFSRNALELNLSAGEVARYRLVMAAGRLSRAELADRELEVTHPVWRTRWVVGGDASFSRSAGRLGSFNGDYLRAGLFTHAELGYDRGLHLALLSLDVEESWMGLGNEPGQDLTTQKFSDEVAVELLYNLRAGGVVGPYVRAKMVSALFDTGFTPTIDTTVDVQDDSGETLRTKHINAGDQLKLFDSFNPLDLRAGAGLGINPVHNQVVNLRFFGGVAQRRATYGEGLFIEKIKGDKVQAVVLGDDTSYGLEAGIRMGLRLSHAFAVDVVGDVYAPKAQILEEDGESFDPVFRVDTRATLSINQLLSVVYHNRVGKQAYEIDDTQISHMLSLRLQHTLF